MKIFLLFFFISISSFGHHYLFIKNEGQWPKEVLFQTQIPNGVMWITNKGFVYHFLKPSHQKNITGNNQEVIFANFDFNHPTITQGHQFLYDTNYFIGKDPSLWKTKVPVFESVEIKGVYENIDLKIYSQDQALKYEFIVLPNADPEQIHVSYSGQSSIKLDNGHLNVLGSIGILKEFKPYSFQELIKNARKKIESEFVLHDKTITFKIGQYDQTQALVIDPELVFSSFSGSGSDNWAHTATHDAFGNLYTGGTVFGVDFPSTSGVFQKVAKGVTRPTDTAYRTDIVIIKYASDGKKVLYASFLGGEESEVPHSMVVNSKNQLVIYGTTSSIDFPASSTAYDITFNGGESINGPPVSSNIAFFSGTDIFLSVIAEDGSKLLASTFLGGSSNDGIYDYRAIEIKNYGDEFRGEVNVDELDQIYIASITKSGNFPVKDNFQNKKSIYDGVVCKLSSNLDRLLFSTFVGGSDYDACTGIRILPNGTIYVVGTTVSNDLPAAGYQKVFGGNSDAFVLKITNNKPFYTYLGTNKADLGSLIDIDAEGNVYVFGLSNGQYPIKNASYFNSKSGQFIQELNADLTTSIMSTTIGSSSGFVDLVPTAFMINNCGNIYLAGWGGNVNTKNGFNEKSTTNGLPITENALRKTTTGSNYYFAILEKNAKSLLFGSFFGSDAPSNKDDERGDHLDGGTCRFDKKGVIYHSACVCKAQGGFVSFPNNTGSRHNNSNCNMAGFKIDLDRLLAKFDFTTNNLLNPLEICSPGNLEIDNKSEGADNYEWFLNDMKISTIKNLKIKIEESGQYRLKLRVLSKLSCGKLDSVIRVLNVKKVVFNASNDTTICPGNKVRLFANGGTTYQWTAGAFSSKADSFEQTIFNTTVFNLKAQNGICTFEKSITVKADNTKADFKISTDATICRGDSIKLSVKGDGQKYVWKNVKDSLSAAIVVKPTQSTVYSVQGFYSDGCKPSKSVKVSIDESVLLSIKPELQYDCNTAPEVKLVNNSTGGEVYTWLLQGSQPFIGYQVPSFKSNSNINKVDLQAKSINGCMFNKSFTLDFDKYDGLIPNVITPNDDKKNDTFVVGYPESAIEIYNSWGKLVFKEGNYKNDWGNKVAVGTYYYKLNIPENKWCKGWIEVIK